MSLDAGRGKPAAAARAATPPAADRPAWRDPWGWAVLLAAVPLVLHSLGAPLGEPVAEDFDFLHQALFAKENPFFGGGGSTAFWRPLAHQGYYEALGPFIVDRPWLVPLLHTTLLALAALLLWAVLRLSLPSPWAAGAASFPLLQESTRMVIAWPGLSVELGLILFSALALHEAARRRMATALASLLAALLCKEVAVVTAAMLPWMPALAEKRGMRWRWALAVAAVVAVWASAYLAVRHRLGLALPHNLEAQNTPWLDRLVWTVVNSVRGNFSLSLQPSRPDPWILAALLAIAAATVACFALRPAARKSFRALRPWVVWGTVWFAASAATLTAVYPMWMPHRTAFGGIGLGLVLAIVAGAAHRGVLAALVAVRLAAFVMSPAPPREITLQRLETGAFVDFVQLVRLERLMAETRGLLEATAPRFPAGARVGQVEMPRSAQYAFGGNRAIQVWYRDTTLRWVRFEEYSKDTTIPLVTIVGYQPYLTPQLALVDPPAVRAFIRAVAHIRRSEWNEGLVDLDRADAEQHDPHAAAFLARVAGRRAACLAELGRVEEAQAEAIRGISLWRANREARQVLAAVWSEIGREAEAEAQLDTVLAFYPGDSTTLAMRGRIRSAKTSPFR